MELVLFMIKKTLSQMLMPSNVIAIPGLIGVVWWLIRPRRRIGPVLMTVSVGLYLLFAMPLTSDLALKALENRAGKYADPAALSREGVRDIVVLSAGYHRGELTVPDRLAPVTLARLNEGVRLWRAIPGARLIVSGGSVFSGRDARDMAEMAVWMGVPRAAVVLETTSWDTQDEAELLRERLAGQPFVLVTSASHLPRSMMIFRGAGLDPRPAPADFRTRDLKINLLSLLPRGDALRTWDTLAHEIVGAMWLTVKSLWT